MEARVGSLEGAYRQVADRLNSGERLTISAVLWISAPAPWAHLPLNGPGPL